MNFEKIDGQWSYRTVLYTGVICVVVFFAWASLTTIDERVRASGRVIPAGDSKIIQHLEGGIINEILVTEGQTVDQGDVLFYIKNQRAESEEQELRIELNALRVKKLRLEAELDDKNELEFSEDLEDDYADIIRSENMIFLSKRSEFNQSMQGLEQQLRQKVLKLDELNATTANLTKELAVAKEQLDIKLRLRKKGAVSRTQYLDSLSEVRNFETKLEQAEKEIPITKSELSELTNVMEETRQKYFTENGEELNKVKVEIKKLAERLESYQDEVDRTAITSPVNGIVNDIAINTIGGIIQPGGKLAEIIPINEQLIVEGRISTNDRGKIWPGLPVVAVITAYDYTLYGGIEGELTYISANSFIDNQNQEYYQIRTSLDKSDFGSDKPVFPGMTAEVNIIVGEISVLYAILKPFWNIRNNALREK